MTRSGEPCILFEDHAVVLLSKPAGLHVFPIRGGQQESLWTWLRSRMPELERIGDPGSPAIVHRLDRYTSGILLAAKADEPYWELRRAFQAGRILKEYVALVEGLIPAALDVCLPLGGRYRRSKRATVAAAGKRLRGVRPARTRIEPLCRTSELTLCRVRIDTGMRHQIRVHLSHLGHPVVGDKAYGGKELAGLGERFFLHALRLCVPKDVLAPEGLDRTCPLPCELRKILGALGLDDPFCSW